MLDLLLPTALFKARKHNQTFRRLGIPPTVARRWAWSRAKLGALGNCHAELLPDGALSSLTHVIDVGANCGDWAKALLAIAPIRKLHMLEPDPRMGQSLEALRLQFADVITVHPVAAGAAPGTCQFNMTSDPMAAASSVLKPVSEANRYYGFGFDVSQTVEVPIDTVDRICADMPEVSLLKLDVQGYEAQVLSGARETLRRTKLVMMEVCFYQHYHGDTLFPGLHAIMESSGFDLVNLSQPFIVGGRAMWADAIYHRR